MTNDPPADDRGAVDSESFEAWLDQAADSKGVSKQELMNQMLSSYWILDELTGLVGETESAGNIDRGSPRPSEPAPDSDAKESTQDGAVPADSGDRSTEASSTEENIREIQKAIQELVEAQSNAGARQSAEESPFGTPPTFDGGVVSVVSELQRQVGKFESKLDDIEDRQETQFERLSNELQLLLDRVSELELDRERFADKADLEGFAEADDLERLADNLQKLDGQLESVRTENDELESRMDREFDSIEELFRRVLDAIDDLDSDIDSATESYRSELEPIQRRETERKQLEELKSTALRRDIRRGTCGNCGQGIDMALLESPECPNCAARFTAIGESGWNPFRAPTLETDMPSIDEA